MSRYILRFSCALRSLDRSSLILCGILLLLYTVTIVILFGDNGEDRRRRSLDLPPDPRAPGTLVVPQFDVAGKASS